MKSYEPGMRILFDKVREAVTVTFRGRRLELGGRYTSEDAALAAGEAYCRSLGWKEALPGPAAPKSLLAHRRGAARPFF